MKFYCGCVTINHKKYRMYFDLDQEKFIFYKLLQNELYPVEDEKIYTNKFIFSEFEQYFLPEIQPPYKIRKNPFNHLPFTPSLTEKEYEILLHALDRNTWLNQKDKEIMTWFKPLLINQPCQLKKLYDRYASLRIFKMDLPYSHSGTYNFENNYLCLNLKYKERYISTTIHELTHAHQENTISYLFVWLLEGMTEIVTYEILKQHIMDINEINKLFSRPGYVHEINICKILCELFDQKQIHKLVLEGNQKNLEHYFKHVMGKNNFYELFGKMTLYFNQVSVKHLDVDELLLDIYDLLAKITNKVYPNTCEPKDNISTYLESDARDITVFLKNYIIPEEKEKQLKKCKR